MLRKQIEPERWERRFSFADVEKDLDDDAIYSALKAGVIEMTQPDKPNSSKQRYRLTALGKLILTKINMA